MYKQKYLDGIRGVAAVVVVILHYFVAFYPALWTGEVNDIKTKSGIEIFIATTPLNTLYDGSLCVCVFFILSGYVLPYRLFKYDDKESIISGSLRRYIRLMIPVLFSIIIAFICMKFRLFRNLDVAPLTSSEWLAGFYKFQPKLVDAIKQGVYGVFIKGNSDYNPVLWTMYYEFWGSFIVFSISYILNKVKNRHYIYIIIIIISMQTKFFPFILGIVICDFYHNNYRIDNNITKIFLLVIGLFLSSYPPNIQVEGTMYSFMKIDALVEPAYFYHSIGGALLIIVLLNSDFLKRIFSNKVFNFLGKISFSMYLIHFVILNSLSSYLFLKLVDMNISYLLNVSIVIIISISIILPLSYCMYKYVDLIGIRCSRYIYAKYFKEI